LDEFPDIPGYKIEEKLGQGRIGDVYLALKEESDQKVVVKVLIPDLIQDKKFAKRFLYEARRAAKLDHPNIVKILDIGETEDHYYFVMEYLPESLRSRIINRQLSTDLVQETSGDTVGSIYIEGVDVHEVLDIFRQLFDALDYAYQEEAIHRDLHPENIFFREDRTPVIADFFMTRIVNASRILGKKRATISSVHYASPERILKKSMNISSDIYSLGVILYEMLTGKVPFDAREVDAIENQHIKEPVPQLPEHFFLFQPLIDRMMAKAVEDRAQSGVELILMIQELNEELLEKESKVDVQTEEEKEVEEVKLDVEKEVEEFQMEEEKEAEWGQLVEQREMGAGLEERTALAQDSPLEKEFIVQQVDTLGRVSQLLQKLHNPRLLIPAATAIVIIVLLVILIAPGGDSGTKESKGPQQVLSKEEKQEIEIRYTRKFKAAQRDFMAGRYEEALQQSTEAEKIKTTKELETLKHKIEAKIAGKEDDKAFQQASEINTRASYEEYLNKYSAGRHVKEAQKKIEELIVLEKKYEAERKKWAALQVKLRSTYKTLSVNEIRVMILKGGFFERYYNKTGNFRNYYETRTINNHKIIMDYATGLIWHQGGSAEDVDYQMALLWMKELNQQKYAGYTDWRLPTLEEAVSLLESSESKYYLYIDPLFSRVQKHIWTGDKVDDNKGWAIDFYSGDVNQVPFNYKSYVRPVRSER
jgi:serine/threonine protein kinase